MDASELTRRQALERILKTAALAGGLCAADLDLVMAAAGASGRKSLQALQVLLSGCNKDVFRSVYGRSVPPRAIKRSDYNAIQKLRPQRPIDPGQQIPVRGIMCPIQGEGFSSGEGLTFCGVYGGGDCPSLEICDQNVCQKQDLGGDCTGVNDCNDQSCPSKGNCGDNTCDDDECPNLDSCGKHETDFFNVLNEYKANTYVQDLMHYFGVATVEQLEPQIKNMLRERRTVTPQQLRPERLPQRKRLLK